MSIALIVQIASARPVSSRYIFSGEVEGTLQSLPSTRENVLLMKSAVLFMIGYNSSIRNRSSLPYA